MGDCLQHYFNDMGINFASQMSHARFLNDEEQEEILFTMLDIVDRMDEDRRRKFFAKVIDYDVSEIGMYELWYKREQIKLLRKSAERLFFCLYGKPLIQAEMKERPLYEENIMNIINKYVYNEDVMQEMEEERKAEEREGLKYEYQEPILERIRELFNREAGEEEPGYDELEEPEYDEY